MKIQDSARAVDAGPKVSKAAVANIRRVTQIIETFRVLDKEMQAQTMQVFLLVAVKPGIQFGELMAATGLSKSAISRNVAALSRIHRKGHSGYDLVEAYEDPEDRRHKRVRLTRHGIVLAARITGLMEGD